MRTNKNRVMQKNWEVSFQVVEAQSGKIPQPGQVGMLKKRQREKDNMSGA